MESSAKSSATSVASQPVFMLVAGELSGDLLGAGLIKALKADYPNASFFGIGGPLMIDEGLETIEPIESLSIMGLVEVIKHLPKLLNIKKRLIAEAKARKPAVFIGIDAPDFNLRVSKTLTKEHITKTVQYVSPSIWVWREGRAKTIKKYIDRVLCLFPFEVDLYQKYRVDAICVGHRLGDEIPLDPDPTAAKKALNLKTDKPYLAVLPGSRMGEITRLLPTFIESIGALAEKHPELHFVIPAANERIYAAIEDALSSLPTSTQLKVSVRQRESREAMEASNAVLLASGTASLEAMLLKKPMVVAYKFSGFTAWLAPKIVNILLFSLPNILAGREIVPELFQEAVTVERIVELTEKALDPSQNSALIETFYALHNTLRLNSDQKAAQAVKELIE